MKIVLIASIFPLYIHGFSMGVIGKLSADRTVRGTTVHDTPTSVQASRVSSLRAHPPQNVNEAFDQLQDELKSTPDDRNKDPAAQSKRLVERYFDLFSGLNRDMSSSEEEASRNQRELEKQRALVNKVIDFAVDMGQDLSALNLETFERPRRSHKTPRDEPFTPDTRFEPLCNVQDDATVFKVEMELPGVDIKDVSIELDKNVLKVSGERTSLLSDDKLQFSKRFQLDSNVDTDKISATLVKGILTVTAPKLPKQDTSWQVPITFEK